MHESVSSKGTPSSVADLHDVVFVQMRERRGDLRCGAASPSENAAFSAAKNCGVASGKGLPASGATTMREILRLAA